VIVPAKQCTQCGKCCVAEPCDIALAVFGDVKSCPALESEPDQRHACGLISHAGRYLNIGQRAQWKDDYLCRMFSLMLGIGMGCDSSETWGCAAAPGSLEPPSAAVQL